MAKVHRLTDGERLTTHVGKRDLDTCRSNQFVDTFHMLVARCHTWSFELDTSDMQQKPVFEETLRGWWCRLHLEATSVCLWIAELIQEPRMEVCCPHGSLGAAAALSGDQKTLAITGTELGII